MPYITSSTTIKLRAIHSSISLYINPHLIRNKNRTRIVCQRNRYRDHISNGLIQSVVDSLQPYTHPLTKVYCVLLINSRNMNTPHDPEGRFPRLNHQLFFLAGSTCFIYNRSLCGTYLIINIIFFLTTCDCPRSAANHPAN